MPWARLLGTKLKRVNHILGKGICWASFFMALILGVIIIKRYYLHEGSIAMQESVGYLHATLITLGLGYTLQKGQHVRVDIFYQNYSMRIKQIINLIALGFCLIPVCMLLVYFSYDYVEIAWKIHERSREASGLPYVYLLKTLLIAFPITLIIEAISELLLLGTTS